VAPGEAVTNYRVGAAYEREIVNLLRREGYTVTRAAGSKGDWDLHARKALPGQRKRTLWIAVYVQCKTEAP
jgi:Holliday junction resolvase